MISTYKYTICTNNSVYRQSSTYTIKQSKCMHYNAGKHLFCGIRIIDRKREQLFAWLTLTQMGRPGCGPGAVGYLPPVLVW
jgi:hypothetical protein